VWWRVEGAVNLFSWAFVRVQALTSTHWEKGPGRRGGSAAFLATLSALGRSPSPRGYEKTRQAELRNPVLGARVII
jgi:hypothetical protein